MIRCDERLYQIVKEDRRTQVIHSWVLWQSCNET